jgi:DNA-binding transcriptional LysR family regulator
MRHPITAKFCFVLGISRIFMGQLMTLDDHALRRLKLSDLRLLHAVVQWGGMAKAAAHLNISQPAVSKAIAALELTLGVRLLERRPQGVEPTAYGHALLKGGITVFDELKQTMKQIEFLADPTAGELRIGCSEPLAAGFVPAAIAGLLEQYPRVTFHVVTADPATLMARELQQRNIDLAIAPTSGLVLDSDVDVEVLFDDRQVVMAGPQNKWLRRRNIALSDLVGEPWMLPPADSIIGAAIIEMFRAAELEPPLSHVSTFSIPLCHHLLAKGRFLAMLPISMAGLGSLPLKILNVGICGIPRPTGIMTLKQRTPSPLAQLFINKVRSLAKPLAKGR